MTEPTPELLAGLEAILMVIDQPVTVEQLSDGLGIEPDEAAGALAHLAAEYDGEHDGRVRGFRLARAAGAWRIYSRPEHHDLVSAFLTAGQSARLSQAALETLAVIAYRQPVTRARISAIRGVNVDGVVRTLLLRGLIVEAGTEETTGGVRFVTTPAFLEAAGLERIEDLPDIAPFLPEGEDAMRIGEVGAADGSEFGIMEQ
jgi:segregation and condensation protein B